MKSLYATIALAASLVAVTMPSYAEDALNDNRVVQEKVTLQSGDILYIFTDGKMAKQNAYGRAVLFKDGEVLITKDGRKITPVGNEVARLNGLIRESHQGG